MTTQQLIDQIQYSIDVQSGVSLTETQVNTLKSVMLIAETLLEKEKEQIINFCWECLRGDNIHTITSNKELIEYINDKYNQTYNQKIPELLYKDGTPMRKVKLGKEAQELLDEATKRFNQPNL